MSHEKMIFGQRFNLPQEYISLMHRVREKNKTVAYFEVKVLMGGFYD